MSLLLLCLCYFCFAPADTLLRLIRSAVLRERGIRVDAGTASRRAVRARPRGTATVTRVITAGGMPGWQIALIALGAALVAATAAVILDRTLAPRRTASAMTA